MTARADAEYALLAWIAEAMFTSDAVLAPLPDSRLAAEGWLVRGYLTAVDAVHGIGQRLYYGFLAEQAAAPGLFVIVVRGTERFVEWVIDAEFFLVPHPYGGHVEDGFYSVYESMRFLTLDGCDEPLIHGLSAAFGHSAHVTIIGHSLGAAIATYITFELTVAAPNTGTISVASRFFASPHPGDADFTRAFDSFVTDSVAYAYEPDLVPRVPPALLGYTALGKLVTLPRNAAIPNNPLDNHHAGNYAWMLDPETAAAAGWSPPYSARAS